MSGEDLHSLFLQVGVIGDEPWTTWHHTSPRMRQAFDAVAAILNERQAERVYEATAGEDI